MTTGSVMCGGSAGDTQQALLPIRQYWYTLVLDKVAYRATKLIS